jgi:signal transduction histidine kinase/PAS domain-containing protein
MGRPKGKRGAMDCLPGLVWSCDATGAVETHNQACRDYGIEPGRRWSEQEVMHADDREAFSREWPGETQARLRGPDQEYRWFLFRTSPRPEGGCWGLCLDIDERKWSEDLVACEKRLLEMIGQGQPLHRILETFCRLFDELSGDTMSAILLWNPASQTLRRAAGPNLPPAYRDGRVVDLRPGPMAGSCGTAAYVREPVFVEDITTDPRWADYYPYQLSHGIRSSWSMPILDGDGQVLGTFAIMADRPRKPGPKHVSILERFRQLARLTIERSRAEEAIRRSRAYLTEAERLSHTGALGWSRETGELTWSEETCRIFDLQAPLSLASLVARVHPEERDHVQRTLESLQVDCFLSTRLLLPDGSQRPIELVLQAHPREFVGAVLDVSERKQSEANLQRQTAALAQLVGAGQQALDHLAEQPDLEGLIGKMLSLCFDYFGAEGACVSLSEGLSLRLERGEERPQRKLPIERPGQVQIPLLFRNQSSGTLLLSFAQERRLSSDEELLSHALANHLVLLLELLRISERARKAVLLDERERVARELHDTLAQCFTGIVLQLEAAAGAEEAGLHVQRATQLARAGLQEARRSVHAMRPQALLQQDLAQALGSMLQAMTAGTSIRAAFHVEGIRTELAAEVEESLLRVGQELVTNSLRHARAGQLQLLLGFEVGQLRLQAHDDGQGFEPDHRGDGMGLEGIRQRVHSLGGRFEVDSQPGQGARLQVTVPL